MEVICSKCGTSYHFAGVESFNTRFCSNCCVPLEIKHKLNNTEDDDYLVKVNLIERFYHEKNYQEVLLLSLKSIDSVLNFVENEVKQRGRFTITQILPIEYACAYLPLLYRTTDLQNIKTLIEPIPEFEKWVVMINHAFLVEEWWLKIVQLITASPGISQKDVWKTLGLDAGEVVFILYHAEQLGIVKRETDGYSPYKLYLVKDVQAAITQDILKQKSKVPV
jgi:hypothetical protein